MNNYLGRILAQGNYQNFIDKSLLHDTMTTKNISQYESVSDSLSLTKIDGQKFTIVNVEKSDYDDNGVVTPGIKITTGETFTIDGNKVSKFHTTRTAIVNKLQRDLVLDDIKAGIRIGPMVCKLVPSKKGGKDYYDLVDA